MVDAVDEWLMVQTLVSLLRVLRRRGRPPRAPPQGDVEYSCHTLSQHRGHAIWKVAGSTRSSVLPPGILTFQMTNV